MLLSFQVITAGYSSRGPSFGTLEKCGVLGRHYEHPSRNPDDRVLVWTVRVPCRINGIEYQPQERIEWPK